jgi:hypothetical protein
VKISVFFSFSRNFVVFFRRNFFEGSPPAEEAQGVMMLGEFPPILYVPTFPRENISFLQNEEIQRELLCKGRFLYSCIVPSSGTTLGSPPWVHLP